MTTEAFIDALEGELGEPYVFGGDSPAEGFDCSGLVYYCAGLAGYFVPRTSEEQWAELPHVVSPLPGDLIFFDVRPHPIPGGQRRGALSQPRIPGGLHDPDRLH